jgi:fluoride ion exporter CrcB/FEX
MTDSFLPQGFCAASTTVSSHRMESAGFVADELETPRPRRRCTHVANV